MCNLSNNRRAGFCVKSTGIPYGVSRVLSVTDDIPACGFQRKACGAGELKSVINRSNIVLLTAHSSPNQNNDAPMLRFEDLLCKSNQTARVIENKSRLSWTDAVQKGAETISAKTLFGIS